MRTSKTKNGVTTEYYLNGSDIVAEKTNGNITLYVYGADGSVIGMMYHGASYSENQWDVFRFEKNMQGDIVAIYNEAGAKLVTYTYDAWGNFTRTYTNGGENTVAAKNPFTYRGYYFDFDLWFYYLNSRYYDPYIGRFINADGYISTGLDLLACNMFAYCYNNPVNYSDDNGNAPLLLIATIVLGIGLVTSAALNVAAIIDSNKIVQENSNNAMDIDTFKDINEKKDTSGLSEDEQLEYVKALRESWIDETNEDIIDNRYNTWSEAEMLREIRYHNKAYKIFVALGSDPNKENSLAYHAKYVDYEHEKTWQTYVFRYVGNCIFWG